MRATKILSEEHQNILKVLDVLERECGGLESGKELDKVFVGKAIDFIKNYADRFHHAKEEDILFKEFGKKSDEAHCNPVEQMLYEHDLGREFVKGMGDGLESSDKEKVIASLRGYVQLLREHIFKEENILYPMIDGILGEDIQKEMLREFDKVEGKFEEENWK
ncbi:cation-binding protein [Candidatus Pacearchaeota archaeon]|nr:cation-binding protein [Candidatus Pacearchaeota archaeon]|tara:strand:+ start:313 stop:801 length:489 start_codon:yes stop_codon:yes gene_type:complete